MDDVGIVRYKVKFGKTCVGTTLAVVRENTSNPTERRGRRSLPNFACFQIVSFIRQHINPPSFASQNPPPLPKEANEAATYCMGSLEKELPEGLRIDLIRVAPTVLPMISAVFSERREQRSLRKIVIFQHIRRFKQTAGASPRPTVSEKATT
ncbi:MAG: hypothetical protein ACI4I3_00255 [Acutalibacteraceae bacterium]